jgi:glycosyltransferase involved in cell wall biosynthesis
MRILWLNHRDIRDPKAGGAERTIEEVASRLVKRGHEVHLVTPRWLNSPANEQIRGVFVHRDHTPLGPHFRALSYYYGQVRPDVVVDDLAHALPWCTPSLSSIPGTAFFRHLHQRSLDGQVSPPVASALKWIERQYRHIYRSWPFVTESYSSRADLESVGIPRSRIVRIPPGVDSERFTPGKPSPTPTIVYFGGMRRYKRPLDALYACKELKSRGWAVKLYMIGSGPVLGEVRRLRTSLGLENEVILLGRIGESALVTVLQHAHVNLHCSITEGWCLSAMEAAACGVPTVGYRVPGLVESVIDRRTGLLVEDAGPKALARGLEIVLQRPGSWTQECRSHAERYSWEGCANSWEAHLTILSGKRMD